MPRIAAAVAVVGLIAFSIGFNTSRYTVVWDMVGGSAHLGQPSQPPESAAAPQPATHPESTASRTAAGDEPSPDASPGKNLGRESSPEYDSADDTAVDVDQQQTPGEDPYASAAERSRRTESLANTVDRLDPPETVATSGFDGPSIHAVPTDAAREPVDLDDLSGDVRRLPPVDQVAPFGAAHDTPRSPAAPAPIASVDGAY